MKTVLKLLIALSVFACTLFVQNATQAQVHDPSIFTEAQCAEYERKLNAILKTRYEEEKKFVSEVVDLVKLGVIPVKLVDTSFQWVRNNRPFTNYPFIYFEKVLRYQAKKLGIEESIPEFDYSIYGSVGRQNGGNTSGDRISNTARNSNTAGKSNSIGQSTAIQRSFRSSANGSNGSKGSNGSSKKRR